MLQALLFDLDGTLTDTDHLHYQAMRQLMAERGQDFTVEQFDAHVCGRANADLCRYLLPHEDEAAHIAFADRKEALFRELSTTLTPTRGLQRLLDWADQQQLRCVVVTNAPRANADHMLAAMALSERLPKVVVAEELPRAKPDPLPYLTGLEVLGAEATQAIAFEDSIPGLTAAVRAGIFSVGIATRVPEADLMAAGAGLVIRDFEDERLWQRLEASR